MALRITKGRALLLVLLLATAFAGYRMLAPGQGRKPPSMTVPVRTAEAISQDVPHYLQGLGTVQASSDVLVTSRVSGHLMAIHFTEGDRVEAGDLLAELDPRPFQAELAKAKGVLARDEAELANARKDRSRYAGLVARDFVARQTYDAQDAKVRQLEGSVASDKAQVASCELDLAYSRITSPVSGRLGIRNIDVGTMVTANDSAGIVRVTESSPCYVLFSLPEVNVHLLSKALCAADGTKPEVEAWSRDQKTLLAKGELLAVDNRIDVQTGTVRLKAVFDNADGVLFPNQFVNARLRVRILKDAVTVPPSAVQVGASGHYVFLIEDGKARRVPIEVGIVNGAIAVVEKGISSGATVVVDGVDRLRDGSRVHVAAHTETVRMNAAPSPIATENGLPARDDAVAPTRRGPRPEGAAPERPHAGGARTDAPRGERP